MTSIDIMELIDEDDKNLLLNNRIINMSRLDWVKQ